MGHVYNHPVTTAVLYLSIIPMLLFNIITRHFHNIMPIKHFDYIATAFLSAAIILVIKIISAARKVYLVDFACYNPDPRYLRSRETTYNTVKRRLSPENFAFFRKISETSGICEETYVYSRDGNNELPESIFQCAKEEAEIVMRGAIDDLLAKTRVDPKHIGIVIVNISCFNPVPSLSAWVVNRYKLREDVLSYSLGGMGCSAGVIAIDLAKRLLQVDPRRTYALVMSVESITSNYYFGNDRSKLLTTCIFRMGGAAILLSNRRSDSKHSKYELKYTLRTHKGAIDKAYNCVHQAEDKDGKLGVALSKDLKEVAQDAIKSNITALGPLVLPLSEKLMFVISVVKKVLKLNGTSTRTYVPDFKKAFEHFVVHTGGNAVLNAMEKELNLTPWQMEPSRMTLYKFGNTSSSSLWYILAYAEAKGRIVKGDRVWQIALGSGFKCNSAVWRAMRTIDPAKETNPWSDVIDQFPVSVST